MTKVERNSIRHSLFGISGFFEVPSVGAVRMTMTMRCKKSAAKLPKPRPDSFLVSLRNFACRQSFAWKKLKSSFAMHRWDSTQFLFHLKQKHEPMALAQIPVLAHQSSQMQIRSRKLDAQFFLRLAARASVRRFADIRVQFPTARAPITEIRLLRALEQQHLVTFVEAVKQRGNFKRQYG